MTQDQVKRCVFSAVIIISATTAHAQNELLIDGNSGGTVKVRYVGPTDLDPAGGISVGAGVADIFEFDYDIQFHVESNEQRVTLALHAPTRGSERASVSAAGLVRFDHGVLIGVKAYGRFQSGKALVLCPQLSVLIPVHSTENLGRLERDPIYSIDIEFAFILTSKTYFTMTPGFTTHSVGPDTYSALSVTAGIVGIFGGDRGNSPDRSAVDFR